MNELAVIPIAPEMKVDRILCATDFADASLLALPMVGAIAHRYHSEVVLAHVWNVPPATMRMDVGACDLEEVVYAGVKQRMRQLKNADVLFGVKTRVVLPEGDTVKEILRIIDTTPIDLLVLGTNGRTGLQRLLMGSVAEQLFHRARCPVITLGPHLDKRFSDPRSVERILVPTDLSPTSQAVIPTLLALAAEFKSRVQFVHVLPAKTATETTRTHFLPSLRSEMHKLFCPQISPCCPQDYLVEFGNTAETIVRLAAQHDSDLIAMGVHKGFGMTGNIKATTAYQVVANATCPVLTVRAKT
jgi:nucleotide-binding universal stress UspA family protein